VGKIDGPVDNIGLNWFWQWLVVSLCQVGQTYKQRGMLKLLEPAKLKGI
jgi:hypothetical protein